MAILPCLESDMMNVRGMKQPREFQDDEQCESVMARCAVIQSAATMTTKNEVNSNRHPQSPCFDRD